MENILLQELNDIGGRVKVAIFTYIGQQDPIERLNDAVNIYVGHEGYNEFVDANMDNPWVRVIIKGINEVGHSVFNPQIDRL